MITRKQRLRGWPGFLLALALVCTWRARADAADEIARLASLMEWKAGTVVADIGAGDGRYSFAAAAKVGPAGRVFATEIDEKKLQDLRAEVKRRNLPNVSIVQSKEADTGLPAGCCDAIFLRRVYHHLTKPADFDAQLVTALKTGGRLAIIDFAPRPGLDPVEGIPSNRGGHGIPEKLVVAELQAAGLQVEREVKDWPDDSYCVVFVKK
ncbi:MAG TPA: methyltransferase domain-containing protein [Candidatus Dormibacteraeota bacterium]|nr:methyltransferase domain-containing protein [Candidatus Dormibacteraeota bacterium]